MWYKLIALVCRQLHELRWIELGLTRHLSTVTNVDKFREVETDIQKAQRQSYGKEEKLYAEY